MASADASRDHGVLFARAYLDSKLAKLKEDQQAYLLETVKEWFDKTDNSSLKALVTSFVGPVLDVLGHIRSELEGNSLTLYSDRSRQKAVSLCYVVGPHERARLSSDFDFQHGYTPKKKKGDQRVFLNSSKEDFFELMMDIS